MTRKLFYEDPYIVDFSTEILKQAQEEGAERWYAILKETAFYPTGGGQPFDEGKIDQVTVTNVEEVDGEVRHYLDQPLTDVEKKEVACSVNWQRRFDHMQQHSGQHILSAAFVQLFNADTVSFHLGEDVSTIDINNDKLTHGELLVAEELANEIILNNRQIETKWITKEELSKYPLRKQPKVEDNIRIVIIPDFDYNGCGGTHPRSTGEVAAIKILSWERQRKNLRIQFVCGNRVRKQLEKKHRVMEQLNDKLNAPETELVETVERLLQKEKELQTTIDEKVDSLLQYEAKELLQNSNKNEAITIIHQVFHERPIKELQKLASMLIQDQQARQLVVLFVNESGDQLQFLCRRDESSSSLNLKKLAPNLLALIDGRGGGKEDQIQGGGKITDLSSEQFASKAKEMILSSLTKETF